jgi:creatinine amidohydrolase/Fe(II)-dependent formamide hydrolase-like protein
VADNGVLGDATGATSDAGRSVLDGLVADLDRHVDRVLTGS